MHADFADRILIVTRSIFTRVAREGSTEVMFGTDNAKTIKCKHWLPHPNQCTMLIAMAGVIELLVFLPAGNTRTPAITPTLPLKLYSIAGASPKA
jgi:hypothetical protein